MTTNRPDEMQQSTGKAEERQQPTGKADEMRPAFRRRTGITGRRWFRPVLAIGACACVAFALMLFVGPPFKDGSLSDSTSGDNKLLDFSDYKELEKTLDDILENQPEYYYGLQGNGLDMAEGPADDGQMAITGNEAMTPPDNGSTAKSENTPSAGSTDAEHSSTYTQVDDVDEADVVKTDGKYIYHVSYMENRVLITSAEEGKTKRLSAIEVDGDSLIEDIYVDNDRLMIISETRSLPYFRKTRRDPNLEENDSGPSVAVTSYDISDRSKPKKTGNYTQSGMLLSSRMTGGRILLVTSQNVYRDQKNRIPFVSFDGDSPENLDIGCIQCIPSPATATFTVVGMIDPSKGKIDRDKTRIRAVLGGSEQIYCSTDELYITASVFKDKGGGSSVPLNPGVPFDLEEETRILKVDFSKGKLAYSAMGTVPGRANDQFSMDARDGLFRIATTSRSNKGDTNNLFVLDKDLKEAGSLRNFARDEHIEAVRYIGKYAYVITYEQIDPLFIIDLSDPKDPEIKGHVKISGFSTLLVPVDNDHVLGFGFATETTQTGESTDGLKLALFDVSDPEDPKVSDSLSFDDVSSEIQYDHKALLVGPNGSYYAIPFDRYSDDWIDEPDLMIEDAEENVEDNTDRKGNAESDNGIMLFDARAGKLELKKQFPADTTVKRCIYIGDWIYAIGNDDSIRSYRL